MGLENIEHVVVVMFENRSFDNLLGWLYDNQTNPPKFNIPAQTPPVFEGLTKDKYFNQLDPASNTPKIYAAPTRLSFPSCPNPNQVPTPDPHEEFEYVTFQIFGKTSPGPGDQPNMLGFLQNYSTTGIDPASANQIMQTFSPETANVINELAKSFAVCDHWFAPVPSQTWPNRGFAHTGSSDAITTMMTANGIRIDEEYLPPESVTISWDERILNANDLQMLAGAVQKQWRPHVEQPLLGQPREFSELKQNAFSLLEAWMKRQEGGPILLLDEAEVFLHPGSRISLHNRTTTGIELLASLTGNEQRSAAEKRRYGSFSKFCDSIIKPQSKAVLRNLVLKGKLSDIGGCLYLSIGGGNSLQTSTARIIQALKDLVKDGRLTEKIVKSTPKEIETFIVFGGPVLPVQISELVALEFKKRILHLDWPSTLWREYLPKRD